MTNMDSHTTTERSMPSHSSAHHAPSLPADLKRKRSPSHEMLLAPAPIPKAAKHNHLQINYLARLLEEDLPLITNDDTLPNILSLLSDYQGVLDRHESMACNLGARPLGPILIKRFERLFDGPPRVLKSHGKDGTNVTWLDVVEFARNKPEQFQLDQMSEGVRVCQFYTKQCRVQISEEDFVLISSGIPQKMIPPQPIIEDEEKELGTLEILEKNLSQICSLADQVAARTRQLNHRLKGRKQAILDRRATASPAPQLPRPTSPSNVALMNGGSVVSNSGYNQGHGPGHGQPPQTSPGGGSGGFVAVNARQHHESNGQGHGHGHNRGHGSSSTTRHELLSKFHTLSERRPSQPLHNTPDARVQSVSHTISHPSTPAAVPARPAPKPTEASQASQQPIARPSHPLNESELHSMMNSPVPIPNTPSNLLPASSQQGELRGGYTYPPGTTSNGQSETSDHEGGDRASTASPTTMMSPSHHGLTPSHLAHSSGQHTPQPQAAHHPQPEQRAQQPAHHEAPHEVRMVSARSTPPERERERERNVESQLQEAAQSSLAHANVRLAGSDGKGGEYANQTMVA
ncbi:c6 finger domain [Pyrenophora seminiperda CCB06]|uniref:C6 finger domain n=1 Tax=Pyrenophora seminiperda CCB06 TaxID=1302712 RepID=A0A3M7M8J2_9PLEO|nr:c6 finger domain [Pyrenophora seminiperda CCB06]